MNMREIKFRAWDNVNKRMGYFAPGFGWNDEYYLWYLQLESGEDISDVPFGDNIHLMQFTGLKDKNGKEIYFGDRVSFKGRSTTVGEVDKVIEIKDWYDVVGEYGLENAVEGGLSLEIVNNIYED